MVAPRASHRPIMVAGIGAGVVLAVGSGPGAIADVKAPSPSPSASQSASASPSPSASPEPTKSTSDPAVPTSSGTPTSDPADDEKVPLTVDLKAAGSAHGGETVKTTVFVDASKGVAAKPSVAVVATGNAKASVVCGTAKAACALPDINSSDMGAALRVRVTIPKAMKSGHVFVTARANAENAEAMVKDVISIKVKPKPKPKPTTGTGGGTSGNTGNTGTSGTVTPPPAPPPGTGLGSGFSNSSPGAVLPNIQPGAPVLPQTQTTTPASGTSSVLRAGATDSQELTFDRLASTQAAWLAALLAAFSLLLTQLRLGKAAPTRTGRKPSTGGAHRKPSVKR